jgi:hypothetical protein
MTKPGKIRKMAKKAAKKAAKKGKKSDVKIERSSVPVGHAFST